MSQQNQQTNKRICPEKHKQVFNECYENEFHECHKCLMNAMNAQLLLECLVNTRWMPRMFDECHECLANAMNVQ